MRYLMEFAQRVGVETIVDRALEHSAVHGVSVHMDGRWLALWRSYNAFPTREWERLDHDLAYSLDYPRELGPTWPYPGSAWWFDAGLEGPGDAHTAAIDPGWSCRTWEALTRRSHESPDPHVINVIVSPRKRQGELEELSGVLSDTEYRVRFETRPFARFLNGRRGFVRPVEGGISVGNGTTYATLGGVLEDGAGATYGVSCGHAFASNDTVEQPAPHDGSASARIGACVLSIVGQPSAPGQRCNRVIAAGNHVDAALIELDADLNAILEVRGVGPLERWAHIDDVYEDSPVDVYARSGHRALYTAGLCLVRGVRIGSDHYCLADLIELRRSSPNRWGVTGAVSPPARKGDSGAWVIQAGDNGQEWCGMVVAGDGPVAYAVFAERIMEWLDDNGKAGCRVA